MGLFSAAGLASMAGMAAMYVGVDAAARSGWDWATDEDPDEVNAIRQQALLMEGNVGQARYQGFMDRSEQREDQYLGMQMIQEMQEQQRSQMYMGALQQEFSNLFQQNDDIITDMMAPLLR